MIKKKWFICLLMIFLLTPSFHVDVQATAGDFICYEEESEGDSESDFITKAIKSIDEATAAQEKDQDYMKNFYNSSLTASTESFNLFDPSTIITMILNMFTYLLEIVGLCLTLFVMVIYNFSSSTFISGVVGKVIGNIEKVVFDWSNPNSWIIKILIISALMGILYQLIKNFTKLKTYKQMVQIIAATVISTSFIIFIGQNGRNIIGAVESKARDMVVETFVFDGQSGNMEISTKSNIFNILQKQPFMLRHYGVSSAEQVAELSSQTLAEATQRVQTLLNDPSQDNAEKEYEEYDNNAICHDTGSAMFILFISLIELIHRVLMSLIIGILCIAAGAIKLAKEMLLWLSIYQLIWWLINRSHAAYQWFSDRIAWSVFAIAADILFSSALYFIMQVSAVVSEIHPLLMIGFDIVLLIMVKFLIKNIGTIIAKIKDNGSEVLQAMITGSPRDAYMKARKNSTFSGNSNGDEIDQKDDSQDGNNEDLSDTGEPYEQSDDLSDSEEQADFESLDADGGEELSDRDPRDDDSKETQEQTVVHNEDEKSSDEKQSESQNMETLLSTDEEDEDKSKEDESKDNESEDDNSLMEDLSEKDDVMDNDTDDECDDFENSDSDTAEDPLYVDGSEDGITKEQDEEISEDTEDLSKDQIDLVADSNIKKSEDSDLMSNDTEELSDKDTEQQSTDPEKKSDSESVDIEPAEDELSDKSEDLSGDAELNTKNVIEEGDNGFTDFPDSTTDSDVSESADYTDSIGSFKDSDSSSIRSDEDCADTTKAHTDETIKEEPDLNEQRDCRESDSDSIEDDTLEAATETKEETTVLDAYESNE